MVGVVLVLLGLAAAGAVVDFALENGLATAPDLAFQLFGRSLQVPQTRLVVGAALLGALAVVLLVLGIGSLGGSRGRRRGLRSRVRDLQIENAELRSKLHLAEIVRVEPAGAGPAEDGSTEREPVAPGAEPRVVLPPAPEEAPAREWKPTTRR